MLEIVDSYPANNAEQVWFNFVPTLTEQLFRLCDRNSFELSYENVHLFVTTLCQLFVSTLFQVVTEIETKLEQSWHKVGTKLEQSWHKIGTKLEQSWVNFCYDSCYKFVSNLEQL